MNSVHLIGRLSRDPQLTTLPSGTQLCSFGIATNRYWKDKSSGERKDEVMFIDCNIFGRQADAFHTYMTKGRQVGLEGSLVLEKWEKDGKKYSKHSIRVHSFDFLADKQSSGGEKRSEKPVPPAKPREPEPEDDYGLEYGGENEDIPF